MPSRSALARHERERRNRLLRPVDGQQPSRRWGGPISTVDPGTDCAGWPDRSHRGLLQVIDVGAAELVGVADVATKPDRQHASAQLGFNRSLYRPRYGE